MSETIAIVGSREFTRLELVGKYVATLDEGTTVVSGGARGVDRYAVDAAKKRGLKTIVFPADWDTHGKAAGMIRNKQIVDAADKVVAFWDGASRGTMHSVNYAKSKGKPVLVLEADNA